MQSAGVDIQNYGLTHGGSMLGAAEDMIVNDVIAGNTSGHGGSDMGMWSADVESGFLAAQMADKLNSRERWADVCMDVRVCMCGFALWCLLLAFKQMVRTNMR
jgi:hypothetical protein